MSYTAEVKARVLDRLIVHLSEVTAAGTEHRERELRRAKIALRTINRMLEEEQKDLETLYGNS